MKSDEAAIRVGVGIMVIKEGKVLIGKRKGSFGSEEYAFAGGHLEYGETLEACALRELSEECGLRVKNLELLCVSDLFSYAPRQYVDVGFVAEWAAGEPEVLEPEKRESWEWRDLDDLPEQMFGACHQYIAAFKTHEMYFTVGQTTAAQGTDSGVVKSEDV